MQIVNMSKKEFQKLKPLELDKNITNTEAQMYLFSKKERWERLYFILKRLYHDSGEIFSNKLYTINELLDKKDIIGLEELIMPSALSTVDNEVVGFLMPYIPNINFQTILDSKDYTVEQKVKYLKEIGEILEKVRKAREYTSVKDFYLNDIHENNFILNTKTGKINVCDLDSSKIGHNLVSAARYLTPVSQLSTVSKYKKAERSARGYFEVDGNTEIYCYIVMIFKYFYGANIGMLLKDEYYLYLEYLSSLGISKEFLDIVAKIYMGGDNINPYEYLDELVGFYGKTHKNTFDMVRTRVY